MFPEGYKKRPVPSNRLIDRLQVIVTNYPLKFSMKQILTYFCKSDLLSSIVLSLGLLHG